MKQCVKDAGSLKDVRDMLTHFDGYAAGTGKLQKAELGQDGPYGWIPMWNTDETMAILNRRKGELEATIYEVSIHKVLKAVALLVMTALESIGKTPSPLLKKLTESSALTSES